MAEDFSAPGSAFFDISDRAKFRLGGSDRVRFLNGQITNDLRKATETQAIEACVLSTKGRIDAHLFLVNEPDAFLLDGDAELRSALPARLERYIIADDVQVEDVSDDFALFHLLGAEPRNLPNEWKAVRVRRFLKTGWDIRTKAGERAQVAELLAGVATFCDAADAEILRIENGVPRWGRELTEDIIPLEANLEERCVDYGKGCYLGQEVISRMKMSGQTNKRLCGLVAVDGSALAAATRLHAADDEREVGWITSAAFSPQLKKNVALGFVKRGFHGSKKRLQTSTAVGVEVVALPFI
jgi:folate-binding protein YgfZ